MASKTLTAKAYIEIDGEKKLWYEVDATGDVTWFLPKDICKRVRQRMLVNIGNHMSEYYSQQIR